MTDTVTISRDEYLRLLNAQQDLADSRHAGRVMAEIAAGAPVLSSAELDDYLKAATPLAFWRMRANKTQAALAAEADMSEAVLADVESGHRQASLDELVKLARALDVKVDDLLDE